MKKIFLSCLAAHTLYAEIADVSTLNALVNEAGTYVGVLDEISGGLFSVMNHGEIQYGKGTIALEGSLMGLNGEISSDVSTYTLKKQHQNIHFWRMNYGYKLSWYDSKTLDQALSTYNGYVSDINGYTGNALNLPALNYQIKGLDADIGMGWNLIDNGENDYFSIGAAGGISTPVIDASEAVSSQTSTTDTASLIATGDTRMWTYKIGPQVKIAKSITPSLWLYGSFLYAYQYARVRNSSIDLDIKTDGSFMENELGIMYRPIAMRYEITDWFALSPKLYVSAGARYSQWELNDIAINLFNQGLTMEKGTLKITSKTVYVGLGYSF